MTTVLVLPNNQNGKHFRAISGKKESFGETVGEALDAITKELELKGSNAVVYVQDFRPDEFFTEAQQIRLGGLMEKWRDARDSGETLSADEQTELEKLIEAEVEGSGKRAGKLADQLGEQAFTKEQDTNERKLKHNSQCRIAASSRRTTGID